MSGSEKAIEQKTDLNSTSKKPENKLTFMKHAPITHSYSHDITELVHNKHYGKKVKPSKFQTEQSLNLKKLLDESSDCPLINDSSICETQSITIDNGQQQQTDTKHDDKRKIVSKHKKNRTSILFDNNSELSNLPKKGA